MKAGSGAHFEQSYNAQAGLEVESRLIVAARVSRTPNDKEQLPPTFHAIAPAIQSVAKVLIDSGFVSEAAARRSRPPEAPGRPAVAKANIAAARPGSRDRWFANTAADFFTPTLLAALTARFSSPTSCR